MINNSKPKELENRDGVIGAYLGLLLLTISILPAFICSDPDSSDLR